MSQLSLVTRIEMSGELSSASRQDDATAKGGFLSKNSVVYRRVTAFFVLSVALAALFAADSATARTEQQKFFSINFSSKQKAVSLNGDKNYSKSQSFIALKNYKPSRMRALGMKRERLLDNVDVTQNVPKRTSQTPRRFKVVKLSPDRFVDNSIGTLGDVGSSSDVVWPIPSNISQRISSPFGYRIHPITGRRAMHNGIDIAAKHGTPVIATHDGLVEEVGSDKYLGRFVKVRHTKNEYSLYGHLSRSAIKAGEFIVAGDLIGAVGSTGRSTGPHLDYSLRRNGKPVNPMRHLRPPSMVGNYDVSLLMQ